MNERIRQLYAKALSESGEDGEAAMVDRLSELIVRECAIIVGTMEEPHQNIAKLVEQHFGVE